MTDQERTSPKMIEVRAKALELTLQMFSIFTPGEVKKTIDELPVSGSNQHKLIEAARVFEIYILGE